MRTESEKGLESMNIFKKVAKAKKYLIAGSFWFHLFRFVRSVITNFFRFVRNVFTKFRIALDRATGVIVRKIVYSKGEIQTNKIFFMTYDGDFTCNLRYIAEEIIKRELPLELVWTIPAKGRVEKEKFPEQIKLVRRGSYSMFTEQASAKIWFDNALNCVWYGMPKKRGQIYINTWHGSMGIKKLSGNKGWFARAKKCNKLTDYCITNSKFEEDVFRTTFWQNVPYMKFGHARNDVFFDGTKCGQLRERALAYFGLEEDSKLFLYAPTFRDNGENKYEEVDYSALKKAMEERFGGRWVVLVRPHFKDRKRKQSIVESEWLKDASHYGDMQELLPAIDAGMTDYSSWAYDYVLTRRPLFLYAPDVAEYDQARGFYFTLESTGFPLAHNNAELLDAIGSFNEDDYLKKVAAFLDDKGCYEDGHACERIVDMIEQITELDKRQGA